MNSQIEKALNAVTKLESWDIQSVLGGVNYLARQAAINTTVRLMPDIPEEGSGLEGFTAWEQAVKNPQIKEAVSPIVGIAERTTDVLREYTTTPPSEYEDVLAFMLQRPPQRSTFEAEYNNRKRLGMRPNMPMSMFVEAEYATALTRHQHLVARGESAVQLLNGIDGTSDSAPEWLEEQVLQKILQKLDMRWARHEIRRTNPKITKQDRDLAEANQHLIESVIEELGGQKPNFSEEMAADDGVEDFLIKAGKLPPMPK